MTTFQRVFRWVIFSVAMGLTPLVATYLFAEVKGGNPRAIDILGAGELFLVTIALCGAAIGDLVTSGRSRVKLKLFSGGMTLIVFLLSALIFAGVSEARISGADLDSGMIVFISVVLFAMGFVGCCVAASEM